MYKIVSLATFLLAMHIHSSESYLFAKNGLECIKTGVIGGISGALAAAVYAPCLYAQNQCNQGVRINWKQMQHCFRGYPIIAAKDIPVVGIQTIVYRYINDRAQLSTNHHATFAAIFAGIASSPLTNAAQLLTLHKQNTGLPLAVIIKSFPRPYQNLGRGIIPTTIQGTFFIGTYTNGLPFVKSKINEQCNNNVIATVSSALFSALLLTITTQPWKVITTKLHADIDKKLYAGSLDVAKKIISQHSVKDFYGGWEWRTLGNMLAIPVLNIVQAKLAFLKNL
jgi:hypothetical protein